MKATFFFSSILLLFIFQGCKKYTCECTAYSTQNPEPGGVGSFIVKGTKAKAKSKCTSHSVAKNQFGNYTECVIK